ncbi:hypothetical protein KY335_01395 [Candidatus Woesearchaeota archaeon]|nr:hypothetical protein [Candidatus Woesearchaeota archaeon]
MKSGNFKIGRDSAKRLVAKPEVVREEADLLDLRRTEVKTIDFIEAKIDHRKKLFDRKSFLK